MDNTESDLLDQKRPDRGYNHFKRYVGLAVVAYNLRRIGQELIAIRRKQEFAERELRAAA